MQYLFEGLLGRALTLGVAAAVMAGCTREAPSEGVAGEAREALRDEVRLAWGTGPDQAQLRPKGAEIAAEGPSAVAVGADGAALVLDRLNERVLAIGPGGAVRVAATIPRDAEHLAVGPDGTLAALSPWRATVWLRSPDGKDAGEIAVPRVLREIQSMSLHISHRVRVTSALQETMDLGSPRAPLDLAAALRTNREGAAFLPDGRGVAARRNGDGTGEILVYGKIGAAGGKPAVQHAHAVDGAVGSLRIVGAVAGAVCARVERVTSDPVIHVTREARCVDPDSGAVLLQVDLPSPGLYSPVRELALGGAPPVLALIHPSEEGLVVKRWTVGAKTVAEVVR